MLRKLLRTSIPLAFPLLWLGAHLSFTRFLIDHFKQSEDKRITGQWLRGWNLGWFVAECAIAASLIYATSESGPGHVSELLRHFLCLIAIWRINEVAYAFYEDGLSKIRGDPPASDIENHERIGMLLRSAGGLIVQFAVLYALLTPTKGFNEPIPDFARALYFSATTMTSIGQEGKAVTESLLQFFHFYQSALGIMLFALALSVYVGKPKSGDA